MDINKIPILETQRLILRPVSILDVKDMYEYASDFEVVENVTFPVHDSLDVTSKTIENVFLNRPEKGNPEAFAIVLKDSGKMIGTCDFFKGYGDDTFEMGYILNKFFWRQGLMYEAAKEVLRYAFEDYGVRRMIIRHHSENIKSQGLIEKLGFIYEGEMRKAIRNKHNGYSNLKFYSLLKEEYYEQRIGTKI